MSSHKNESSEANPSSAQKELFPPSSSAKTMNPPMQAVQLSAETASEAPEHSESYHDSEAQKITRKKASHFRMVFDQTLITPEVLEYPYTGSGTSNDPFIVQYLPDDERNPMLFREWIKWAITLVISTAAMAVAFVSSAYTGGLEQIIVEFNASEEVGTLGVSLFVLGFAIGPLLWAPLSEVYGRQVLYIGTYMALTAFNAATAGAQNITTLLVMRFFAGAFGASPLTNSGGVLADIFPTAKRGIASAVFATAPFLGPALGPICGGFLGQAVGWRWVEGFMALFTGAFLIIGALTIPETYSPVILRRRAAKLSKMTGKVYISILEVQQGPRTFSNELKTALVRPWKLLFTEPIVFILSIFMAIVYGTLYLTFAAFPIVYEQNRGWSLGIGSLSFLGLAFGIASAMAYLVWSNTRYVKALIEANGRLLPEARLPPAMIGCVCLPISLFWFAWTNYPTIHWSISIVATVPFGFGMSLVFLSSVNYLIDTYVIYAASVLAASSVLRSLFGAAFPLFTTDMYNILGIHWASSIPAFLALICVPFPFLLYKYGASIRMKCKYSAAAAKVLEQIQKTTSQNNGRAEQPSEQ